MEQRFFTTDYTIYTDRSLFIRAIRVIRGLDSCAALFAPEIVTPVGALSFILASWSGVALYCRPHEK